MFSAVSFSILDIESVAKKLIHHFPNERVFAFYGKMGAGKTTFIQSFCKALGSDDNVTSPTFALINEYSTKDILPIFHFDFYRINDLEEVFDLGYEDYLYSGHYCLIEWPEMIESLLPERFVEVRIEVTENDHRTLHAKLVE